MQLQVAAERKKRAFILESEGQRASLINVAEGEKQSKILASEAIKTEQINKATGESEAIWLKAKATSDGLKEISQVLQDQNGNSAMSFSIAEKYMHAFEKIAKQGNTLLLPAEMNNPAGMVAQALAVFQNIQKSKESPVAKVEEIPSNSDRVQQETSSHNSHKSH
eukprot:Sdes_comp16312_c0_seq1m5668